MSEPSEPIVERTGEPPILPVVLVVDDALRPGTHIGPVVDASQFEQDLSYIGIGQGEGAKLAALLGALLLSAGLCVRQFLHCRFNLDCIVVSDFREFDRRIDGYAGLAQRGVGIG